MIKLPKIGLLPRIAIAICLGIGVGFVSPDWLSRLFVTFNYIFSQFLGFMIPMIIVGFVAPAIADIGNRAGRMLAVTALLAYGATILSGLFSYCVSDAFFPTMISDTADIAIDDVGSSALQPYFKVDIPAIIPVNTSLVLAFMLGLGIAYIKADALRRGFDEFRSIVSKTIMAVIIPLLPLYIFGIFLDMTVTGKVGIILRTFFTVIVVIFIMHILLLLFQYVVAGIVARRNPLKMLWTMMPAYFTALGTQSSAATIPVTLRQSISMGIDKDVAGFCIPLCATIHMSGSTLKLVSCALALMVLHHIPYDFGLFMQFILMLGVTIVAAPGIPGGAIMASLGLLSSVLGFTEHDCAMMIALYIAMDSFGTACNVTGDGALAAIVDRIFRRSKPEAPISE